MKFLLLNQTFHPDVMASAQYLTQLACALATRGHEVTVVTSRHAYDDPATQFPAQESWRGIKIYRVTSTVFGKGAKWRRAADFASFMVSCCARLAMLPRADVIVALTSPPLISFIGAWLARLRGSRFVYWVMDFNPDEAIAAGWLRPDSLAARLLDRMSRFSLRRAHKVIALDRFMRDRIVAKGILAEKVVVLPPWSQDDQVRYDAAGREQFRDRHGLAGKFVVMYSGNHSPIHPLDTLIEAANLLAGQRDIVFCFIGGGSEFQRVKRLAGQGKERGGTSKHLAPNTENEGLQTGEASGFGPKPSTHNAQHSNVFCLPYQPMEQLSASLSAADAHVVIIGNGFVGLVHPCKIYNVLAVGAPVLYIGPQPSHVSEILHAMASEHPTACAAHGQVESLAREIQGIREQSNCARRQVPADAFSRFSMKTLLPRLVAEMEAN